MKQKRKSEQQSSKHYYYFVAAVIIFVLNNQLFSHNTINDPYLIFFSLTFIILLIKLISDFSQKKSLNASKDIKYLKMPFFFAIFISYTSVTLPFYISNYYYSKKSPDNVHYLEIKSAFSYGSIKTSKFIKYMFEGEERYFYSNSEKITLLNRNPKLLSTAKFYVILNKGLFNTYIIKNWDIVIRE